MSQNSSRKAKLKPAEIIAIQDLILDFILSNDWKDYEGFARKLSERILRQKPKTEKDLLISVESLKHPFYSFNTINKSRFLQNLPQKLILERLKDIPEEKIIFEKVVVTQKVKPTKIPMTCSKIFPELEKYSFEDGLNLIKNLNVPERLIQNTMRMALRERGATNMVERKSDTSLEVADLEDFSLKIDGKWHSFVSVIKGFDSLTKARVRWVDVIHQITKGYQGTHPDYVLLVLAKDTVDGLITQLVTYGETVGNRNLIILMDTVNLARFLRVRNVI